MPFQKNAFTCVKVTNKQVFIEFFDPLHGYIRGYLEAHFLPLSNHSTQYEHNSKMSSVYLCLSCDRPVTTRQQALLCDSCGNWCHRTCGTGISQDQYRSAVRLDQSIDWKCMICSVDFNPNLSQSTPAYGKYIFSNN